MRRIHHTALLITLFIMFSLASIPAYAGDATVNTCDLASFSSAIATADSGGGTITFNCSGTITFTSEFTIAANVTINANGNNVVFFGNNSINFFLVESGATLTLNGVEVHNGSSPSGGAIDNNGTVNIISTRFLNNSSAGSAGGAIYNTGTLTIVDSIFELNSSFSGGAIYNGDSMTITNTRFLSNTGTEGGAIYNYTTGTVNIIRSYFENNTFTGGAMYNRGTVTTQDTHYANNSCYFTGIMTDNGGNTNVGSGGCPGSAPITLSVTALTCNGNNAQFGINAGDNNFDVTGTGAGLPILNIPMTTVTLSGAGSWTGVTVTERRGERQSVNLGDITCPNTIPLSASAVCVGADLQVTVSAGDANFQITADSGLLNAGVGLGSTTLTGPRIVTNLTVTELNGNTESLNLGNFTCHTALSTSATCIGADLQVTISAGDANFQITADSGTLVTSVGVGTHTITGPVNETNVTVTEFGGNSENFVLGNFNCFISETLTATAVCNGANLDVTISNGNAPFSISVTDSVGTMNSGGQPLGVYTFTGPDTFSNIGITEDTGDLEVLNLPDVTCTAPVVPPVAPAPVVLSPDLNALGCELTSTVEMPNASDNTYCRVLMRDGAVIGYSGAIPTQLVNLGVIFAMDVYQLRGGQAVNEFVGYQQICLAGQGRLFYMDSRNAPRVSIELATETVNGLTCGWIPAPGTLILTN